jgi:hypothetical protein
MSLKIVAQENYTDIVVRINYTYLNLDLIDKPSFNTFKFNEILNQEGKEQLKELENEYENLGSMQLSKIFGFMSWKDSISIARNGNKITIPPFWATFTLNVPSDQDYRKLLYFLDEAAPLIDYAEPSFPVEMQSTQMVPCTQNKNHLMELRRCRLLELILRRRGKWKLGNLLLKLEF